MSNTRQPSQGPEPALRSLALDLVPGYRVEPHAHAWPQLVHARSGVLTLEAEGGTWVVPPGRAVWVPSATRHALSMSGHVQLRTLYLRPDRAPFGHDETGPGRCRVLAVPPLLRELIDHAIGLGPLHESRPEHRPVIDLICGRIRALATRPFEPLELSWPTDPRARRLGEALQADPANEAPLAELARGTGAGLRTLERIFRRETGMSAGRWRQQLRLLAALQRLAAGEPVTSVALEVGYQSSSAFVVAFKRTFGTTPGRYFR